MDESMIEMMGRVGVYAPLFLGAIGSILGCAAGGQAACGAMLDVEGGYGRLIGVSALPSSQTIYGIVVMLSMNGSFQIQAAPGMFAIGVLCGLALLFSGWFQGKCCASAIHATKSKPEVFGLSVAPAAIVEGFAVFAFVFALILAGGLPAAAGGS
ncbi:ATP synthase subunit C [Stieleria mannarensis]|uniref:ATP synthase subunit C n=1 Tax=Stieleria mannarensis TaxID=2755585 RepID=UPI001600294C|nr:ATP synthase subunit C [Rhodopirellula sp. JC639]